jgi:aryl-alcohol dehydrogenase-like predicted oxidoreductase
MGCDYIDILYLHNFEVLKNNISYENVLIILRSAIKKINDLIKKGLVKKFGLASWGGFIFNDNTLILQLADIIKICEEENCLTHLGAIQFPFNIKMLDAIFNKTQNIGSDKFSILKACEKYSINTITSAPLLQGHIDEYQFPNGIENYFGNDISKARLALLFVKSTPNISSTIVGVKSIAHLEDVIWAKNESILDKTKYMALLK